MKLTIGRLRQIVQEERSRLHEGLYPGQFNGMTADEIVDFVSSAERRGTRIRVSARDLAHLDPEDAEWVRSVLDDEPPMHQEKPPSHHPGARGTNPFGAWRPRGRPGSGRR